MHMTMRMHQLMLKTWDNKLNYKWSSICRNIFHKFPYSSYSPNFSTVKVFYYIYGNIIVLTAILENITNMGRPDFFA